MLCGSGNAFCGERRETGNFNRKAGTMTTAPIVSTPLILHDHPHAWLKYRPFRLFTSPAKCQW
jgi:hypothetical protein